MDVFTRKGYRFKGIGKVLSEGPLFEEVISFYKDAGSKYKVNHIVLIKMKRVIPLLSPVYDSDVSEEEVIKRWSDYWNAIYKSK